MKKPIVFIISAMAVLYVQAQIYKPSSPDIK